MIYSTEQFTATQQANIEAFKGLTSRAYVGFEKLLELNLAASKAVFADAFQHAHDLTATTTPQQLVAVQIGLLKPLTEKSAAYGHHVHGITNASWTEFAKACQAKLTEAQQTLADFFEKINVNAPKGTEIVIAAFRNAVNSSQNLIESAQTSAQTAVEVAESNFTMVTDQAITTIESIATVA